ncbi:hypothetical protein EIN_027050 [Entamoeba invadens IP1]|uniref:hypothetical protein n=1 Tax=Entamoeba invadens IP1 TaxID=370355 RepID=UPI0002C3D59B|nr:hypothetical protein EIN_027050 [Entamoeba invadens IP1]ELP90816.1 hypothetical protein EIN_027050 [Entamoeba invadens IP1]|eukprot:XP_004257587.1 hypothetical protein EIN_027050 [Entamoeba invadens IP1]
MFKKREKNNKSVGFEQEKRKIEPNCLCGQKYDRTEQKRTENRKKGRMEETKAKKEKREKTDDAKRRAVDWLGDRLMEKIDRDHYICIICFKRMSRGYACYHCIEEHQNITDDMKPLIVKLYMNGKRVKLEFSETHEDSPSADTQQDTPGGEKHKRGRMSEDLKQRLQKLENEGKAKWETKPKKEVEKLRTVEGKRITTEISKIMAANGIPFAKSEAIWKIVTEVIDCTKELGPPVIDKIRFSARTLKRRYEEMNAKQLQPNNTNTLQQQTQQMQQHQQSTPPRPIQDHTAFPMQFDNPTPFNPRVMDRAQESTPQSFEH